MTTQLEINPLKTFQIGDSSWSGYDLDTFLGGLMYYREVCSPEKSFHSAATITKYLTEVRALQREKADSNGEAQLTQQEYEDYRHKRLVLASSASDSGKVLPWAVRTSSFIPMSIPLMAGMVLSPPTMKATMFWQWMNQTYMAGLNYGNANGSSMTTDELFSAYCMATGTAIGVACTLRALSPFLLRGRTGGIATAYNQFVSFAAVASSSAINVYAMRQKETVTGVSVKDEATGEDLGLSKVAATAGLNKTMLSRATYCIPMFAVPAMWTQFLTSTRMMPRGRVAKLFMTAIGLCSGLYLAMPLNCALFP